jgi:hypothetical protein
MKTIKLTKLASRYEGYYYINSDCVQALSYHVEPGQTTFTRIYLTDITVEVNGEVEYIMSKLGISSE